MGSKKELEECLRDLKSDCVKVIEQLTINGCDHAWSIIKLNNMILDIDYALAPTCMTCGGDCAIEDTTGVIWNCPECKGKGKPLN